MASSTERFANTKSLFILLILVLVGYEGLLRPQFGLSASAFDFGI